MKKCSSPAALVIFFAIIHLFNIIHHYSPLFTTIHHYSPLFTIIHQYSPFTYSPLFIIIHQYSPLFTTIHHYSPLFTNIHPFIIQGSGQLRGGFSENFGRQIKQEFIKTKYPLGPLFFNLWGGVLPGGHFLIPPARFSFPKQRGCKGPLYCF